MWYPKEVFIELIHWSFKKDDYKKTDLFLQHLVNQTFKDFLLKSLAENRSSKIPKFVNQTKSSMQKKFIKF